MIKKLLSNSQWISSMAIHPGKLDVNTLPPLLIIYLIICIYVNTYISRRRQYFSRHL